jgi:hypothetical protein
VTAARCCRFCGVLVDVRESGGDPDGGWSHLECWARAGHPDVGYDTPFGPTLPPFPIPPGQPVAAQAVMEIVFWAVVVAIPGRVRRPVAWIVLDPRARPGRKRV